MLHPWGAPNPARHTENGPRTVKLTCGAESMTGGCSEAKEMSWSHLGRASWKIWDIELSFEGQKGEGEEGEEK